MQQPAAASLNLEGKHALVTGGGIGLGGSSPRRWAPQGRP